MSYSMNDKQIDSMIGNLVADVVAGTDRQTSDDDLVREIIVTALKLIRDGAERGDVKMMNTALKELRYSSLVFEPHRGHLKVAVYGSARTKSSDPNYQMAEEFGRRMAEDDWMVITGAGPGIMEAANKGAGTEASFGVNIRLPFENGANEYLSPGQVINFKYFFTRKVQFVKESDAFALFPGGYGTMDEAFELLTLVQTGKSDMHPIVMIDHEGTGYWRAWQVLCDALMDQGMISADDANLYLVTSDLDEAIAEIERFFRVYHSQRYVDGQLVLRLKTDLTDEFVAELSRDFAAITVSGTIRKIEPTQPEIDSDDNIGLPRIAFDFNRRSYGQLRALIDRVNDSVL